MSETVKCGLCNGFTSDIVYRGRLQCCGVRVFFGRCCKEKAVMLFDTLGAAGVVFGKLHTFICSAKNDVIVDETETPKSEKSAETSMRQSFSKVRDIAVSEGHIIDGSWVLVIPKGDRKATVARLFGDGFKFAESSKPSMCKVEGEFLGIFEGVPVFARWDVTGTNAVLCRQTVIGSTPDRSPPN